MGELTLMGALTTFLMILGSLAYAGTTTMQARPFGDDDIEAHLNRLNKPAVKTIMLKDGDVIDCVDIYMQPAFDHPLLKNHKIKMPSSFISERNKNNEPRIQPLWQESEGCPDGTIPIRRVQKNDIIRATSTREFEKWATNNKQEGKEEVAGMYVVNGAPFHGAGAAINIWEPFVEKNEWSKAAVVLTNGDDYGAHFIPSFMEAGWMVSPKLFGDGKTRLYVYWTADGYNQTGCFNVLCPGFVQVSGKYILGGRLQSVSRPDDNQFDIPITIHKDDDQNWWLDVQYEKVGYWPRELFNKDFEAAAKVTWAGIVLNTNNKGRHTTTEMGSGLRADHGHGTAAYFKDAVVTSVDTGDTDTPQVYSLHNFTDTEACYNAIVSRDDTVRDLLYYGGGCR